MAKTASALEIRKFILQNVEAEPIGIAKFVAEHFGITRQAVYRYLKALVVEGALHEEGRTRRKSYALSGPSVLESLSLREHSDEYAVWLEFAQPLFRSIPENVLNICHYGFTEIYNNAVAHSEGDTINFLLRLTPLDAYMNIHDNGIGIFEKIKSRCNLADHRQAILELSKGKLTTDPDHHTGEGIFFASRAFDNFFISANELDFGHTAKTDDWLLDSDLEAIGGTDVHMRIPLDSPKTMVAIFDQYTGTADEDFGFSKTHVPLTLARLGNENLISRSQARRVLARVDRFREVILDFEGVELIGQGFADEVFRVYQTEHPEVKLVPFKANESVDRMIKHVLAEAKRSQKAKQ